jgi:AraC-like DNA-binding protein
MAAPDGSSAEYEQPGPESWGQRVGGLTALPKLTAGFGVDPAPLIAEAGLAQDALGGSENRVPFLALLRLLAASIRATGCPHLGLLVGQAWTLSDYGMLGELIRNSATLGDALRTLVLHHRLYTEGGAAYLAEYPSVAVAGYVIHHPSVDRMAHPACEIALGLTVSLIRELCGESWRPSEVELPLALPADPGPYRRHFRCPIRFDATRSVLLIPPSSLRQPIPGADPRRRVQIEAEIARCHDDRLAPLLYRSLRLMLLEGTVTGDALAQVFSFHRRTLQRRIAAQGTTFQTVLDEVRRAVACQLLRDTDLNMVAIAGATGFAEASSFARFFRRRAGMTPLEWRSANRSAAAQPGTARIGACSAGPA